MIPSVVEPTEQIMPALEQDLSVGIEHTCLPPHQKRSLKKKGTPHVIHEYSTVGTFFPARPVRARKLGKIGSRALRKESVLSNDKVEGIHAIPFTCIIVHYLLHVRYSIWHERMCYTQPYEQDSSDRRLVIL